MVSSLDVAYRIDASDCITTVSDGWVTFAEENSGERLLPPGILGASLWPWIADDTTRYVYRRILARVREGAGAVRFQFRCDAPDRQRLLLMQITLGAGDDIDFRTTALRSQPRARVELMDADAPRTDAIVTICGWCMRLPVNGTWLEIEGAIPVLGLFEASAVPRLSHGICPGCLDTMLHALDHPELSASGQVAVGELP